MTPGSGPGHTASEPPPGELLCLLERMIVAPATGVFRRADRPGSGSDGSLIGRGDVVGTVLSLGNSTPVQSPFEGSLVGMLAMDGERVRPGQPVAWLRVRGSLSES